MSPILSFSEGVLKILVIPSLFYHCLRGDCINGADDESPIAPQGTMSPSDGKSCVSPASTGL